MKIYKHALLEKCKQMAMDAVYDANLYDEVKAYAYFNTHDGSIELICERGEQWEIRIDNSTAHPLPRLHKEIMSVMPPFEQVEEEEEDEDEEENSSGLDPAFSSWDDVRSMSFVAY